MKKLILLVVVLMFLTGCSYSEGERHGVISKFSKKGVIFKTWEGQMITGGVGSSASNESIFDFSVPDSEVRESISSAMRSGEPTTLIYEEKYWKFWWEGETVYFIVGVQ